MSTRYSLSVPIQTVPRAAAAAALLNPSQTPVCLSPLSPSICHRDLPKLPLWQKFCPPVQTQESSVFLGLERL